MTASCAKPAQQDPTDEPVVPVHLAVVTARSFMETIDAAGVWKSQGEAIVAAPFAGIVETVTAHVGDVVRSGQALGFVITLESRAAARGADIMKREARDSLSRAEALRAERLAHRELVRVALVAPAAGVVVRRSAEPGTQVAEAAEVLAIVPWTALVFEAHVPGEQRARIKAGEPATILEPGVSPRPGAVQRILPSADPADQSTRVWIVPRALVPVPQLDHFGTASITVGTSHTSSAVPESALVEDDLSGTLRLAVVDTAGRVQWRVVTAGSSDRGWRELRAPALAPGVRIVVEGQRGLPDSARVRQSQ